MEVAAGRAPFIRCSVSVKLLHTWRRAEVRELRPVDGWASLGLAASKDSHLKLQNLSVACNNGDKKNASIYTFHESCH